MKIKSFKDRLNNQNRTRRLAMMRCAETDPIIYHYVNVLNLLEPKKEGERHLSVYLKKAKEIIARIEPAQEKVNINKCWYNTKLDGFIVAIQHKGKGLVWYKLDQKYERKEVDPSNFYFSDMCAVGLLILAVNQLSRLEDQVF